MIKNKYPKKKSKWGYVLFLLASWLPVSKRTLYKYELQVLEILAAQREMQMVTRQDIMILANKMVKFHGAELMKEKSTKDITEMTNRTAPVDNTENMYG